MLLLKFTCTSVIFYHSLLYLPSRTGNHRHPSHQGLQHKLGDLNGTFLFSPDTSQTSVMAQWQHVLLGMIKGLMGITLAWSQSTM